MNRKIVLTPANVVYLALSYICKLSYRLVVRLISRFNAAIIDFTQLL